LGDVRVKVPADTGVSLESRAAISSVRLDGTKQDGFFVPVTLKTDGYEGAGRRLEVEVVHLLGDVRVERGDLAS
jgi:predicted membrane protein